MNAKLIEFVKSNFLEKHKTEPLLIFSPGRINLIGEHTDYNEGFVFPAAINMGIVIALQKSTSDSCSVTALDQNETYEFNLDQVSPLPNGGWRNYVLGVVSGIINKGGELDNFNIVFSGDIPSGSGLSSSAALENSMVFGLNTLFQLGLSKKEMIYISQQAEHEFVGVKCGIMDQYASMFGERNSALLLDCQTIKATPFYIDFNDYEIVLLNTNVHHNLSDSAYNDRRSVCQMVASLLNLQSLRGASEKDLFKIKTKITEEDYQKALFVIQENQRVLKTSQAIQDKNLFKLGELLYESHAGLRNQYMVSCDELDFLVQEAGMSVDVIGARMMGGGFGGCTINLIKKNSTAFLDEIKKEYLQKFNRELTIYKVQIGDGVKKI